MKNEQLKNSMQESIQNNAEKNVVLSRKRNRRLFIIAGLIASLILIVTGIAVATYRYDHQFDNTVFTTTFVRSNYQKWWLKSQNASTVKSQYEKTKSQAKKILLEKLYSGHTIYLTGDGKPFIISGTTLLYLVQSGRTWDLSDSDKASLRTEYDGQKVSVGTKSETDSANQKIQMLADYTGVKGKTALAVNGQLVKENIYLETDGKGDALLPVSDVLPYLGGTYSVKKDALSYSFTDAFGAPHSFNIAISKLRYQPWIYNSYTFPAISKDNNQYYIAKQILFAVFGYRADYNRTKAL